MARPKAGRSTRGKPRQLRLIGGRWRGRRLPIPKQPDVRPTPDRVRETLFNWLQGRLPGSCCLDLFAGSGALGLEALSRGAAHAVLIDDNAVVCRQIRRNLDTLAASGGEAVCAEALSWLHTYRGPPFDIVFVDPPFQRRLILPVLELLATRLAADGRVYVEQSADEDPAELPDGWHTLRERCAGRVRYRLLTFRPEASEARST